MNENRSTFDLLTTIEYGGCSAKLPAGELSKLLSCIPLMRDSNIMVDIDSHDDAGVYRLNDSTALIVTTDFFPPVCSDPFTFGEIAVANSLSDVYAMGGKPLLVLNLNMFPSKNIPLEVLRDILMGGQSKINESGAFTMGGHTIDDDVPKYGLAVVGTVEPDKLISNAGVCVGDLLILTKPLGIGVMIAAHRLGIDEDEPYNVAINQMKLLNRYAAETMSNFDVKGATDITGFGLMGHILGMCKASNVTIEIDSNSIPVIPTTLEHLDDGCVPGAVFRNMEYTSDDIEYGNELSMQYKLIAHDPQTSGGLLISVSADNANQLLEELKLRHPYSAIIGKVLKKDSSYMKLK